MPPQDLNGVQAFQLSVAVSFSFLADNQDQDYAPPPPPVLFKVSALPALHAIHSRRLHLVLLLPSSHQVPYDVFYPFSVNSGPRRTAPRQTAVYGAGVLASLLLVLLL